LKEYLSKIENHIDLLNFVSYLVYFFIRVTDTRNYLPFQVEIQSTDDSEFIKKVAAYTILVAFLIGLAFLKILSCLLVDESYGHLVGLLKTSLKNDLQTFTIILFSFIIFFSFFNKILGVEVDTKEYSDFEFLSLPYIIRNSISDLSPPSSPFWSEHVDSHP
jgi:hypothetical protein